MGHRVIDWMNPLKRKSRKMKMVISCRKNQSRIKPYNKEAPINIANLKMMIAAVVKLILYNTCT